MASGLADSRFAVQPGNDSISDAVVLHFATDAGAGLRQTDGRFTLSTNRALAQGAVEMPLGPAAMPLGVNFDDPRPTWQEIEFGEGRRADEGKVAYPR